LTINCNTIEEAEEAISRYPFDLVIADIRLSGMYGVEGLELLTFVKERCAGTHVIIMTAYGSDEMRDQAYARGAFHYYEKPVDIGDLILKVKSIGIE
jgi:DNA-binding NtrC family response regulator